MEDTYIAREKKPGLWYVEGPGWGEPIDRYCEAQEIAQVSAERMSQAFARGVSTQKTETFRRLNDLFDLGMESE